MKSVEQRFWEKVGDHSQPDACWLWLACTCGSKHDNLRYGRFRVGDKRVYAHRFAYELLVGPIPEGFTIDHVKTKGCTSTLCVNPAHLEAVTLKVNILRGIGLAALNTRKVVCPKGHPYDEENTRIGIGRNLGKRCCRACDRERHRLPTTPDLLTT